MEMKRCRTCGEEKPLSDFYVAASCVGGRKPDCKSCKPRAHNKTYAELRKERSDALRKARHANNPLARKDASLRAKYGITLEDKRTMYIDQNGRCAICKEGYDFGVLFVDHCHTQGHVRALLCNRCNAGIGSLQENPDLLRVAAAYIEGHRR